MKNYTICNVAFLLFMGCTLSSCELFRVEKERSETFATTPERLAIPGGRVDEASGLAASQTMKGYLWAHNDSGNPADLFLISPDGKDIRQYTVPGADNRDWEDIAVGPGPDKETSYIYIGDFGNNNANPNVTVQTVYRLPELRGLNEGWEASAVARILYRYPDGPHDAETLLIDSQTRDIYIVSKDFEGAILYRLPFPQAENDVLTAEKIGRVPDVVLATGGDIAADGKEIIIRTYSDLFYWKRGKNETVSDALTRKPLKLLPYELEPQGEAVCFEAAMKGYYTLSELRPGTVVTMNYFRRN